MGVETTTRPSATTTIDPEQFDERTAAGVFYRQAARLGDKPLYRYWREERWNTETWNSTRQRVLSVAASLLDAGVRQGDRVIIFSPNCLEWLVSDLAIASIGAVSVPIYPTTIAQTAQLIADNSQAALALVANQETASRLQTNKTLKRIVRFDEEFQEWMKLPRGARLDDIVQRAAAVKADDLGTIIYTSGTTGEPKGVMLAHRNLVDVGKRSVDTLHLNVEDVSLSFLPYAHSFERLAIMAGAISGASGWLSRGKDRISEDLQEITPTLFPSVPMIFEKMYRTVYETAGRQPKWRQQVFHWAVDVAHRRLDGERGPQMAIQYAIANRLVLADIRKQLSGGKLRFFVSGGAPLGVQIERFFWALDIKILQGWGLTETSATATVNTLEHHRFGTVGRPIADVELKLAEDGEILIKSPGVMLGYYRNEKATKEVLQDGWFKTGDIGEIDSDGFLKITDRKKDLIKTAGGKYVAPQGIEAKLQNERYIERVVVIGDERPYVTALIVPNFEELKRDGMSGDPKELAGNERVRGVIQERIDKVNGQLDHYEAIQYFEVLERDLNEESGELTPTLKPKRRVINENYRDLIEGMYQGRKKDQAEGGSSGQKDGSGANGSQPAEKEKAEVAGTGTE